MSPSSKCSACRDGQAQPFPFSMAFQPILNTDTETLYAYEALVRGPKGESAASVINQVTEANRYSFDQSCRVQAITHASRLGLVDTGAMLSINFMPGAVYSPVACIQLTLRTARECNFPSNRLIFEFTESEKVAEPAHLRNIIAEYRRQGFRIALDDFGAGYSGLNLLAELPPDIIKLDMELTRNLDRRPAARCIVNSVVRLAASLGSDLVAEGVETLDEFAALRDCGISLMQGYLFAKPAFEALPSSNFPEPQRLPSQSGYGFAPAPALTIVS
jgi:EAL domain-containing protein (putative c-di-GMP-specific phosphodiesterase class I)